MFICWGGWFTASLHIYWFVFACMLICWHYCQCLLAWVFTCIFIRLLPLCFLFVYLLALLFTYVFASLHVCWLISLLYACFIVCLFVSFACLCYCLYFALEWNYLYATLHNRLKTALWMQHHSDHEKSHSIEQVRTEKCFSSIKFFFNLQRFESLPFQPNQRSAFTHRLVIDVSSCIPISEDIMCSVQYLPVRETHIIKYIALIKYQMQAVRISSNAAPNGITLY